MFNYKHKLKYLGVKYVFPSILDNWPIDKWCVQTQKPSGTLVDILAEAKLHDNYCLANKFMAKKSAVVNELFLEEKVKFFKEEEYNKEDLRYLQQFLTGHFSQKKHLRVLLTELIGHALIEAQNSPTGLKDDLKVRKIINERQKEKWERTTDILSLAVEILNAASYSADDVFDKTMFRYDVPTVYKKHGHFAGVIGADILFHYLGNYIFYKTIRQHEKGVEEAYLGKKGKVSVNKDPYSLKWESKEKNIYVYINPEQYMDVWEVWTWSWYMINSGQIRDLYEFKIKNINNFDIKSYVHRTYRLSGGFIETLAHLSAAFVGCGYWVGRQNIGKWAAIYGTMTQIRNDFFDYVVNPNPGHKIIKETHEDVGLGRTTLPLGFAYLKANKAARKIIIDLAKNIAKNKRKTGNFIEQRMKLNKIIADNGGFRAVKYLVYNLTYEALEEILKLKNDFKNNIFYWQLVSWTHACLNIVNIFPEKETKPAKEVDIFDIEKVYEYLKK